MALANYFYNQTTRKYVALFGTYFNQLKVCRSDAQGNVVQDMIVPISYAPFQKVLSKVVQDGDREGAKSAIQLPRMSFEITSLAYDSERKISPTRKIRKTAKDADTGSRNFLYSGQPYDFEFSLYIMAKYNEDAIQLVEQIIPFFRPDMTNTVTLIPGLAPLDIPLILNSVSSEDVYEGSYEERQAVLWTLTFTMKGWFFGPEREKKVIKFIDADLATNTELNTEFEEQFSLQPGLTAEGGPTTLIQDSIDLALIDYDDDYGLIKKIGRGNEMIIRVDKSLMIGNTITITVPQSGFLSTRFDVDWGDGSNEPTSISGGTANTVLTHTYTGTGTADIKLAFAGAHVKFDSSVIDVIDWGENTTFSSAAEMFKGNENLVTLTASNEPNFLPGSSTSSMFEDCINFTGEESSLENWDISNVIDTSNMFKNTG